jgi:hypothetical protein
MEKIYSRANESEHGRERARAFIEKSFDVALYVGPPVASDWHRYLRDKLVAVFGNHLRESSIYEVTKVFETAIDTSGGSQAVTPRKLNTFVNKLGALWLSWQDAVSFASLAYYSFYAETVMADVRIILVRRRHVLP